MKNFHQGKIRNKLRFALTNSIFIFTLFIGFTFGFSYGYIYLTVISQNFRRMTINNPGMDSLIPELETFNLEHSKDLTLAKVLEKKIRILCMVMTTKPRYNTAAKHVKATWGHRCSILLFMTSSPNENLPTISLNISRDEVNYWGKTKEAFRYVFQHHFHDVDWFLKADDDTYFVMENLRYLLKNYNTSDPIHFGCDIYSHEIESTNFLSGGAGYVLSKEALRRFITIGLPNERKCKKEEEGFEDVEIEKCLKKIGVKVTESVDKHGLGRFFPLRLHFHVLELYENKSYLWLSSKYNTQNKKNGRCCSDHAISFHRFRPPFMYVMEYLLYRLHPYGISPQVDKTDNISTLN